MFIHYAALAARKGESGLPASKDLSFPVASQKISKCLVFDERARQVRGGASTWENCNKIAEKNIKKINALKSPKEGMKEGMHLVVLYLEDAPSVFLVVERDTVRAPDQSCVAILVRLIASDCRVSHVLTSRTRTTDTF